MVSKEELKRWLVKPRPADTLLEQVRRSPSRPTMLNVLRQSAPELGNIPQTTYTLYREFEKTGVRGNYERVYFAKRAQLSRAVIEMILGDESRRDIVHDLLWSICEETSWVLPAHEEQGPDYWDLKPSPRTTPLGAHTTLTREPDAIDLFAAETGASLAETVYFLGEQLAPEVVQRVRQEIFRHIFKPYLYYGRRHWWYKGALNWNGVCNGAIGLTFMRLERDPEMLAGALAQVLEGLDAYIATGFEADGGSIEGIGYWNYGLLYYVTLAELLREQTDGALDLLASPRMRDIATYPLAVALSPGLYVNFGDANEALALNPGIVSRLVERTGVTALRGLIVPPDRLEGRGYAAAKLAIMLRDIAWWDGQTAPWPAPGDSYLPACALIRLVGQTATGRPLALAAKAGHNDGHHSHTDVGQFIFHVDGESLLCDPGRGLYSRDYFRQNRYQNIFNNAIGHSVPRIGGQLQAPGPEFGGRRQSYGTIAEHGISEREKFVVIDFHTAYDLLTLTLARRTLRLDPGSGETTLDDQFAFDGDPLTIEEAFVTWCPVEVDGATAQVIGKRSRLALTVTEPADVAFRVVRLEEECRANQKEGVLNRLIVNLPAGACHFRLRLMPISL